jgi:hypothetical protein
MKQPKISDYPRTDERTYYNINGSVNWEKYALALENYIEQIRKDAVKRDDNICDCIHPMLNPYRILPECTTCGKPMV